MFKFLNQGNKLLNKLRSFLLPGQMYRHNDRSPETHPPCLHPWVCVETKQVFSVLSSVFSLNSGLLLKLTESVLCLQSFLCFKKYSLKLHIQSCYFCKNSEGLPTALQYSHKALYNPALNNISKHIILPSPIPTFQAH